MKKLTSVGIVRAIGGGRKQQYEISLNDILVQAVAALFSAETDRFEHILASIRKCIEMVELQPISAWIPSLPTDSEHPIKICILQDASNLRVTTSSGYSALKISCDKGEIRSLDHVVRVFRSSTSLVIQSRKGFQLEIIRGTNENGDTLQVCPRFNVPHQLTSCQLSMILEAIGGILCTEESCL